MTAMTDLPKVPAETIAWIREKCPTFGIYGDSNQGKTHFAGTLFYRAEYWPVRYIDCDDGESTIAAFADNPDVCQLRSYSKDRKPGQDEFSWFLQELHAAKTAECGSIIVEGITRQYQARVNAAFAKTPDAEKNELRKLYIPAANRAAAIIGALQVNKQYRKQHNTGVPCAYTLNVKEQRFTDSSKKEHTRLMPALSSNKNRSLMEGCDAFVQIVRDLHGSRLLCDLDPDGYNPFRKVRNEALCNILRTKRNPDFPWLLDEWVRTQAAARAESAPAIEQILARYKQTQPT